MSKDLGRSVRFARASLKTFETPDDLAEPCGRDVYLAVPLLADVRGRTLLLCEHDGCVLALYLAREATLNYHMSSGRPPNSPFDPGSEGNFPRFKTESRDDHGAYLDRTPHRMCVAVAFLNEMVLDPNVLGDVVLARKDIGTSYHIAVTVDDARQGITCVTRGEDLLEATHVHRQLQALLGLPAPDYAHHRLLVDADGKRFAKRDKAVTIQSLREDGQSADAVRAAAGF